MKSKQKRTLYVFDFDNTLVNTADVIRSNGYNYDFDKLDFYDKATLFLESKIKKGFPIVVLSCRNAKWKGQVLSLLKMKFNRDIDVFLVKFHWMKWVFLQRWSLSYNKVILIDDMMKSEETGIPKDLFFPPNFNSRITIRRGFRVIKWRE